MGGGAVVLKRFVTDNLLIYVNPLISFERVKYLLQNRVPVIQYLKATPKIAKKIRESLENNEEIDFESYPIPSYYFIELIEKKMLSTSLEICEGKCSINITNASFYGTLPNNYIYFIVTLNTARLFNLWLTLPQL